ncbi:NADH dehydrogenase ubiquinone Fe-S protein 4 [Mesorhizobium sp. CCNWLW176]|uniref:NADH dehydrogenase ubiquinone Fe-S protein 4 n=1 Tax=unclassified Mesorhizobium TaxID=325217 RepID=UPI003FA5E5C1
MTELLTQNEVTNRIKLNDWRSANANPMKFPAKRPSLSGQISARIFRPGRSVMTSARVGPQPWRLVFERRTPPFIVPLMGYTGGDDTLTQVTLDFPTREAAIAFAERQSLDYAVLNTPPERPRPNVRSFLRETPGSIGAPDRKRSKRKHREVRMATLTFLAPVQIGTNGAVHEIGSVQDAMTFLKQWPRGRRGPVFTCAERSCNAAIAGQMSVEQARQAFVSFARIAGVLIGAEPSAPLPKVALKQSRQNAL